MTHFRIYHKIRGGHVHMQMFAGPAKDLTHGKCGDLRMTREEFVNFRRLFTAAAERVCNAAQRSFGFTFVQEGDSHEDAHSIVPGSPAGSDGGV